jgi:hypothetical protein
VAMAMAIRGNQFRRDNLSNLGSAFSIQHPSGVPSPFPFQRMRGIVPWQQFRQNQKTKNGPRKTAKKKKKKRNPTLEK